jgi:uncharacterized protein YdeI (YjbR/CyaY-like superfamily)
VATPTPRTFGSQAAFRTWLKKNHQSATELFVRIFKAHVADQGLSYAEALDEALCYGWIDGVRHRLDADSFSIRFTPRKPRSIWSRVNVGHVERLIKSGRMTKAGMAAWEARDEKRTGIYAFERPPAALSPAFTRRFRDNEKAWSWFQAQPPWYRRTTTHWVMNAKREETRERRLAALVDCCARGSRIPQVIPGK